MIKIGIVIAIALSLTPLIADLFGIEKKLRGWMALIIIIILNIFNSLLFGDGVILDAVKSGIEEGVIAVGIYSTGKNTVEYMKK